MLDVVVGLIKLGGIICWKWGVVDNGLVILGCNKNIRSED